MLLCRLRANGISEAQILQASRVKGPNFKRLMLGTVDNNGNGGDREQIKR
jgi:hypothetical protein